MPSQKAVLEKEVWLFPIYKYGTKKYVPMMYALPLAYIVPTLLIILLSPLTYSNALLFQMEYILIALFYGLLGILTRSKLRSLLNIIPAALSYITVQFIIQGLFNFNPPINDPYAAFNIAGKPITVALKAFNVTGATQITGVLFIVDLFFIFILAEIGGFFTAVISTGFWNPRGEFSIIAVIAKAIAVPIAIIFIIILPLMLHGVSALVDGGAYIGAGTSELSLALGYAPGGKAAQTPNLANLDINALKTHSEKAAQYFSIANDKLSQLKGNLIVQGLISSLTSSYSNLNGFQNITNVLDVVGSVSEMSYVLPEVYMGFISLNNGFNKTLPIITSNSPSYNPKFAIGLNDLTYAFENFSLAWNGVKDSSGHIHSLQNAIDQSSSLSNVEALQNYVNIGQFFNALKVTVSDLLTIRHAFVQFMNGTYETSIAMVNMANNNFVKTNFWMTSAIDDFIASNTTLSLVPSDIKPVEFSLYPNGDGGASGNNQTINVPIAGVINIAKDLNNLLIRFAYGGLAGINVFDQMDNVMTSMGNLNFTNPTEAANPVYWDGLTNNLTQVNTFYHYGLANLTEASALAQADSQKSYGPLLDSVFVQGQGSFFNTLATQVNGLKGNFTDYGHILDAFTNTTLAMKGFSFGSYNLQQWGVLSSNGTVNTVTTNATLDMAIANFTASIVYADAGYNAISQVKSLAPSVVLNWKAMLKDPANAGSVNDKSLTGADTQGINTANFLKSSPQAANFQGIISIVSSLNLGNILGTGS